MQIDSFAFWGIFLFLTAVVLLVKVAINFRFPVVKLLTGSFLLLLVIKLVSGNYNLWPFKAGDGELFFTSSHINDEDDIKPQYQLVFSDATFDLDSLELHGENMEVNINSVFSGSTIYLPPGQPVSIHAEALFASVKMPERYSPVMGTGSFSSADFDPDMPHIKFSVNIVLGSVVFLIHEY